MNRMTVTIDDELVEEAKEVLGVSSKSETIRLALLEVVRRNRLKQVLDDAGKIDLDLDQALLQKLRRSS